jgi:hypothetical protein
VPVVGGFGVERTPEGEAGERHAADRTLLDEGSTLGALDQAYAAHNNGGIVIYYSMFGFQRTGDLAWAAGDSRARG